MTDKKEDILKKHYQDFDIESGWMFDGSVENVFKAMDEYAKQQAIAFAKEYNKGVDDRFDVRYDYFIKSQNKMK